MAALFALISSYLFQVITTLWLSLVVASPSVPAQDDIPSFTGLDESLAALSSDEREELLVFVAGNVLFTLYHEGGHMLISELELPVLAQEEDAVDNLATVSMLAADTDNMDLLLTNAMIGWFVIAEEDYDSLIFYDEHDLDQQRGYRMLCLMVGADEDIFLELAQDLGLPEERIETCGLDYEQAADSWEAVTDPFVRDSDTPGGKIEVVHERAPAGHESMALFLKESGLMEQVARELDTFYDLPEKVTFRAAACDEENAFWDPEAREVILCHEMLSGFADVYLDILAEDD
ncbi:MAG: DUF4344 domain-containing metallopeptidase [Roseibium sp.]|uniref:DUF4344 domain-containing metallopeptidase n=1 Tax=Roseibium sp. TaxID=1936156 RepID=UPI0026205682|nr:DUF4344 domain-containing metallopeptidase [Roseibium sp.]MCV0427082.1 DUF4344 domain-containing metallopeptidase [Roseibium sp.]